MTMTRLIAAAALTVAAFLGGAADAQSPVIVKIATIAPEGSPWHDVLLELAQRWRDVSHGAVQVKIYAGGSQGDEAELVRKVRIGLLQGVAVTSSGLDTISPGFSAFSVPLLIESYEELDYVRDRISPRLTQSLLDHGFVVVNWGDGGWVRFFTTRPARTIDDVRRLRTFTWAGHPQGEELWKQAGFHPVPLAPTDILTSLQAGLIEGCPVPPTAALAYQWFGISKYMLDIKIAPVVGATVVSRAAWERIDPSLRPVLLHESELVGARLRDRIRSLDGEAITAMRNRGLQVVTPTPELQQQWRDAATAIYPKVRGGLIPAADFDQVVALVRERRGGGARR
jgi:TRAP-type C4-dicarboxylate transport system substrate-binding protein